MTGAMLAVGTFALLTVAFSWTQWRFPRLRPAITGRPILVFENGKPVESAMKSERFAIADLLVSPASRASSTPRTSSTPCSRPTAASRSSRSTRSRARPVRRRSRPRADLSSAGPPASRPARTPPPRAPRSRRRSPPARLRTAPTAAPGRSNVSTVRPRSCRSDRAPTARTASSHPRSPGRPVVGQRTAGLEEDRVEEVLERPAHVAEVGRGPEQIAVRGEHVVRVRLERALTTTSTPSIASSFAPAWTWSVRAWTVRVGEWWTIRRVATGRD